MTKSLLGPFYLVILYAYQCYYLFFFFSQYMKKANICLFYFRSRMCMNRCKTKETVAERERQSRVNWESVCFSRMLNCRRNCGSISEREMYAEIRRRAVTRVEKATFLWDDICEK